MKTRVLWCGEASVLRTGYATYGREILSRLNQTGKFEIAEFAAYVHSQDRRIRNTPWKIYANVPDPGDEQGRTVYDSNSANQFGQWRFEEVCLDFMPHVVIDIRDFWMFQYEETSPFRPYFNLLWMPTIDAPRQAEQWLATYAQVDGIFTYQDWSAELLQDEANGKIKWLCSAPPAASPVFRPNQHRDTLKERLGFGGKNIVGTIMRNQRRKLYPDLFRDFRRYLDETGDNDTLLYCHTSYPDRGWEIPDLILENGLSSKTLFTYVCADCNEAFPAFFSDAITYCLKCGKKTAGCPNANRGVDDKILSGILNLFDVYVQYANSEGFGMPQVEAAACGVPVMAVDFSAMSDVVRKLNGVAIDVLTSEMEVETGCLRAIPDGKDFVNKLKVVLELSPEDKQELRKMAREGYELHYSSWDKTAEKWEAYLDDVNAEHYEQLWHGDTNIQTPEPDKENNLYMSNMEYAKFLISRVLCDTSKLNSYMESRLIRDLNYEVTTALISGMYFNELSHMFISGERHKPFSRKDAYEHMKQLCDRRNYWESMRCKRLESALTGV